MINSTEKTISINHVSVPRFIYGTAWKEDQTEALVESAIEAGFRGIDTANQRKHYFEAAVGQAISSAIGRGVVARSELFLQTKFTFKRGQDHRLPYDPSAPISTQVEQSFASSLENLGVETIDSYLLHGPSTSTGLKSDDWDAWRAMEAIHDRGQARLLGISNVSLEQLKLLCREARVPPKMVQIRCYANRHWDSAIRQFCDDQGIVYQGFSLLTANRHVLSNPELAKIASQHQRSPAQIIFRFALDVGMLPLTGTTDAEHMQADLEVFDFQLKPEEIEQIAGLN